MVIPLIPAILGVVTWIGMKAIPAVWKHHSYQPTKVQIELSKDLCANHNDCEAQKKWAIREPEKMKELP